jgi:pyrroline-5-carboxylate reductase
MSDQTIGFIGGGRVTRILLEGWKRANAMPADILVKP